MNRAARMGSEVGQVAAKLATALGCPTCGIGIGIDMVGKRWGEPPYDWKGERFGHDCELTRNGLTPHQVRDVEKIEQQLEAWSQGQRGGDHQASIPDPRLPPEHDDVQL